MKITHYCNSFLVVNVGETRLACDPWIGISSYGGWMTYPITEKGKEILFDSNPTALYISHVHADHMGGTNLFSENMLTVLEKYIPIYIKNFKQKHLYNRIKALGFENIIELTPWEPFGISKEMEITIFPCDTSNIDEIPEEINYDIDTSILIRSLLDDTLFYNNVDSTISMNGLKRIKKYASNQGERGTIDIACIAVGAASEFPQCFPNIDRFSEKKRIIKTSLSNFLNQLDILGNTYFFPAGGNYIIPGKFSPLNNYVALPTFSELKESVQKSNFCKGIYNLEGGNSIERINKEWKFYESKLKKFDSKKRAINENKNIVYEYKYLPKINNKILDDLFLNAKQNYFEKLSFLKIDANWMIIFKLYDDLKLDKNANIENRNQIIKTYILSSEKNKKVSYELQCHLDKKLFFGAINGDCIWNLVISGHVVIFERKPNIFIPTITFSLNFLVVNNEKKIEI